MLERPDHPRNAYAWMDVFRALAAILVAISHVRDIAVRDASPSDGLIAKIFYFLTGFGHTGVVVFFVLSGFWITRSVMNRMDQPGFWPNYLIDRVSRLWVVLLPVLVIGGTLDWMGSHLWQFPNYLGTSGAHSIDGNVGNQLGIMQWVAGPLFLAKIAVPPLGSNGPLWSLSFEFWYYIWFPALAMLLFRRRPTIALVFLGIGIFSPLLAVGFISWLAGSALHFALKRFAQGRRTGVDALGLVGMFALVLMLLSMSRIFHSIWFDPVVAVGFAMFLFFLCRTNLRFPKILSPVGSFGSMGSFSLYALHFPVAMAVVGWWYGGVRREPTLSTMIDAVLLTFALVAIGWVFSRVTEARTDAIRAFLKARIANRTRTATV